MATRFAFLPHAATGIAALAASPNAGESRLRLDLSVEVQVSGTPTAPRIGVAGALRGPGDVIGIESAMIVRVEPASGLRGFEPNYMPFVEFRDADFPWRYSAELADARDRRKPWLALVALKAAEFEASEGVRGPLARIKVFSPSDSLPDLAQSWATAHVQLNLGEQAGIAAAVLKDREEDSFARLLCLRKLEPNTSYFLFLVPTYEMGRRVGLGEPALPDAAPDNAYLAPAWQAAATDPVDLPVYKQWRFVTDALEDVEVLMRRLRALRADEADEPGAPQRATAEKPGYYPQYNKPGAAFTIESSMRQPGQPAAQFETDEALADAMVATLNEVIAGETSTTDDEDPLVAFPPHGFRFRPDATVVKADAKANKWFHRINLDLKFRLAAGLGAEVIRRNQELFVHHAWLQYDEIEAANAELARAELAKHLADRLVNRHFGRLATEVVMALAEPLQPYARADASTAVIASLRAKGVPSSFASRALRRVAAKRPMASSTINGAKAVPMPGLPGDTIRSARLRAERPLPSDRASIQPTQLRASSAFSSSLARITPLAAFEAQKRPVAGRVAVQSFTGSSLAKPLVDLSRILPAAKIRATLSGLTPTEIDALKPIWRAPSLPFPLAEYLREVDTDAILANATALPENTLAFFVENRSFIEAFMVGANHEMNNELRWREFPTDMRGTVFARFWHQLDPQAVDIPEIHTWTGGLSTHFPGGDNEPNLIVVIRGDIVRKLREPILEINIATTPGAFVPNQGQNHAFVFKGLLGADIAYWGFNVSQQQVMAAGDRCFLVIYEPMGRFRFGLDVATASIRNLRRDMAALNPAFPFASVDRAWKPKPRGSALVPSAPQAASSGPATPDDLSWSHMRLSQSGYIDASRSVAFTGNPAPPPLWNANKTSASLARSFWQKPVAGVLPLKRVT